MSNEISFDDSGTLGYLSEGVLRKQDGAWYLELEGGGKENVEDFLARFKNKDVRLSVVDLKETEHYHETVLQAGYDNEDGGT